MRSLNKQAISNQSTSADVYSAAFNTDQSFAVSAQLLATGNVYGNFKIQGSDDPVKEGFPINWIDIPDTGIAINGPGTYLIQRTEIACQFHRLAFIDCSGGTSTGFITCNIYTQGF